MKRMYLVCAVVLQQIICFGDDPYSPIKDLIRSISRVDVPPRGADVSMGAICGPTIEAMGGDTNRFFDLARAYCTNLCMNVGPLDRNGLMQYRGVLNILRDYDATRSKESFAYCATNSQDEAMTFVSALCYSECASDVERASLYVSSVDGAQGTRDSICRGIVRAFEINGGSGVETNRMALLGLSMLSSQISCWHLVDKDVCVWWPDYATSSNRYVAAQRALQTVPPPASSNYLNRVIAELEALPPGTMRMLSTNHLGQAWQE